MGLHFAFQHPVVKKRDGTGGQCGGGDLKHSWRQEAETHREGRLLARA